MRAEALHSRFQQSQRGADQVLLARSLINLHLGKQQEQQRWQLHTELIDARHLGHVADQHSDLGTSSINPTDLLQLQVSHQSDNTLCLGCRFKGSVGRFTLDLGSRRLVARNRFRNTINAFSGLHTELTHPRHGQWQLFYTAPVQRRLADLPRDNHPRLDKANRHSRFSGLYHWRRLNHDLATEVYWLKLAESQNSARQRRLDTLVNRWMGNHKHGQWQLEWALQRGQVGPERWPKRGHFVHAEIALTTLLGGTLTALGDYASGDNNDHDQRDNSFDSLFGARRFDYGPTSIYGPFVRSNLISPGLSWRRQLAQSSWDIKWRHLNLAKTGGSWPPGELATGSHDQRHLGQQLELRWRWQPGHQPWRLEAGAAYLHAGDVLQQNNKSHSRYLYGQFTLTL